MRDNECVLVDLQDEVSLVQAAKTSPGIYVRSEDGRWHNPALEAAAASLGFIHMIEVTPVAKMLDVKSANPPADSVPAVPGMEMFHDLNKAGIYHTECDLYIVDANKNILGRPWVSLLVNAGSMILASVVHFDPPSGRDEMLLLQECVRLNNYLPGTIEVENTHRSQQLEIFAAVRGTTICYRPRGAHYRGQVVEHVLAELDALAGTLQRNKRRGGNNVTSAAFFPLAWIKKLLTNYNLKAQAALGGSPKKALMRSIKPKSRRSA